MIDSFFRSYSFNEGIVMVKFEKMRIRDKR